MRHDMIVRTGNARRGLVACLVLSVAACAPSMDDAPQTAPVDSSPVLFRATGNEPGWLLEIRAAHMTLVADYGAKTLTVAAPAPEAIENGRRYAAAGLTATVLDALCVDGMSGRPHPQTVSVRFEGRDLHGCGGDPADLLRGDEWTVRSIGGAPVAGPPFPTLRFDEAGRIAGSTSCNSYTGAYAITGEGLTVSKVASTRKACLSDLMEREQRFLRLLEGVRRFDIGSGGELVLEAADGGTLVAGR